ENRLAVVPAGRFEHGEVTARHLGARDEVDASEYESVVEDRWVLLGASLHLTDEVDTTKADHRRGRVDECIKPARLRFDARQQGAGDRLAREGRTVGAAGRGQQYGCEEADNSTSHESGSPSTCRAGCDLAPLGRSPTCTPEV